MTTRRDALKAITALAAAPALVGLASKGRVIAGGYVDDDHAVGHALRDGQLTARGALPTRRVRVAIVGGGMGGLSAGWRLDALGMHDWVLCELGARTGGNARGAYWPQYGQAAPWGAHYVPVPSADATHVRDLLRDLGVLGSDGQFDERVLCHSPQERLFQHGRWHEGLEPFDALTRTDREQFARFQARIDAYRESRFFAVPAAPANQRRVQAALGRGATSAIAREVLALDTLTADAWMQREGFTSPALRWWVEYGTRDDYGAALTQASAWAAVHYFAARDREETGPLTWPEGNDWIAQQLTRRVLARRADDGGARLLLNAPVRVITRDATRSRTARWIVETPAARLEADVVIWSAPLFMLPRVCASLAPWPTGQSTSSTSTPASLEYAPWVVANLVLDRLPREQGAPLAWDNVIFGSPSLGYVNAAHQHLGAETLPTVWTWYHAVVDRPPREARQWLLDRPWSAWRDAIIADLTRAHPDIEQCVARIDVRRWGHAMARPTPGVLARAAAFQEWAPAPRLLLAHADLSGFSLFEEAQWHGVQAADSAVRWLG